jgi:hypothetical protein
MSQSGITHLIELPDISKTVCGIPIYKQDVEVTLEIELVTCDACQYHVQSHNVDKDLTTN